MNVVGMRFRGKDGAEDLKVGYRSISSNADPGALAMKRELI